MAFTRALYYPWMDINDEGWLKNAMLYWENIYSIVPMTLSQPYQARTAREFFEAGLLLPYEVDPFMPEIEGLTSDVLKYLETPEGTEVLTYKQGIKHEIIHADKLQFEIRDLVEIHQDKLPFVIMKQLQHRTSDDWIAVDKRFADFYMTLLATRISEKIGAGLLTDKPIFNKLATVVKVATPSSKLKKRYIKSQIGNTTKYSSNMDEPHSLAQGILANLVFSSIRVAPNTPVKKILQFRTKHADELGRFRTSIAKFTEGISEDQPAERMRQQIEDIYINEVKPTISLMERGLSDSAILWNSKNILSIGAISLSSLPLLGLIHLAPPYTLLADVGISFTASAIQYNRERADRLRQNPYSYVLSAKGHLSQKRPIYNFKNS